MERPMNVSNLFSGLRPETLRSKISKGVVELYTENFGIAVQEMETGRPEEETVNLIKGAIEKFQSLKKYYKAYGACIHRVTEETKDELKKDSNKIRIVQKKIEPYRQWYCKSKALTNELEEILKEELSKHYQPRGIKIWTTYKTYGYSDIIEGIKKDIKLLGFFFSCCDTLDKIEKEEEERKNYIEAVNKLTERDEYETEEELTQTAAEQKKEGNRKALAFKIKGVKKDWARYFADNGFINERDLDKFSNLMKGKALKDTDEKIMWKESKGDFKHFIEELWECHVKDNKEYRQNDGTKWEIAAESFTFEKGDMTADAIRKTKENKNGRAKKIDDLIRELGER